MNKTVMDVQSKWLEIVRKLGGKHIKKLTSTIDSLINRDDKIVDTYEDVMILKDSKHISICTYHLKNRDIIMNVDISNITELMFEKLSANKYLVAFNDGFFTRLDIEL